MKKSIISCFLCILIGINGFHIPFLISHNNYHMDKKYQENLQAANYGTLNQIFNETKKATIKETDLYARAAVLMDADSKRVLYEKAGEEVMPMASTTKIMTCITVLENSKLDDILKVSQYASSMPDVQLNIKEGEQYYVKDLLYSLMLESHNDSAVALAEHVGGTVEGFADLMNQKARELGCNNTYFITPNGLDAANDTGTHSTTATDLARIMAYCIKESPKREEFLEITRTTSHSFTSVEGNRSFSCSNHNAFLNMMDGALSGKTGFTNNAGYCYVGALERDGKTFVVALLACGWPNNKGYKWRDTKKLMNYGLENYEFKNFDDIEIDQEKLNPIYVKNGQTNSIDEQKLVEVKTVKNNNETDGLLLREDEKIELAYEIEDELEAPVKADQVVGRIRYLVDGEVWREDGVIISEPVKPIDLKWCLKQVLELYIK